MRESFEDYIGPSPQSRIDIDDIVVRSRRVRRRRRTVAACATALAVVGVTVLSVVILPGGGGQSAPVATVNPTAAATVSPTPQVSEHERLLAALKAAIAREAPQVSGLEGLRRYVLQCSPDVPGSYDHVLAGPGVEPIECPLPPGMPPIDIRRSYRWQGQLTSPTGTYTVTIRIRPSVHFDPASPPTDPRDAEERRITREAGGAPERGPNGEHISVFDYELHMTKPGGTGITIRARDTDEQGISRSRSPFTAAQLTAIGLDPLLHL